MTGGVYTVGMKKTTGNAHRIVVYIPRGHDWPARILLAAEDRGRPRSQFLREAVLGAVEKAEAAGRARVVDSQQEWMRRAAVAQLADPRLSRGDALDLAYNSLDDKDKPEFVSRWVIPSPDDASGDE